MTRPPDTPGLTGGPPRVQPFAALLYREEDALEAALEELERLWSPIARRGEPHPFNRTDYYAPEMGEGLLRVLAEDNIERRGKWYRLTLEEKIRMGELD